MRYGTIRLSRADSALMCQHIVIGPCVREGFLKRKTATAGGGCFTFALTGHLNSSHRSIYIYEEPTGPRKRSRLAPVDRKERPMKSDPCCPFCKNKVDPPKQEIKPEKQKPTLRKFYLTGLFEATPETAERFTKRIQQVAKTEFSNPVG